MRRTRKVAALALVACVALAPGCLTTSTVSTAIDLSRSPQEEKQVLGGVLWATTPVMVAADVLLFPWNLGWLLRKAGLSGGYNISGF